MRSTPIAALLLLLVLSPLAGQIASESLAGKTLSFEVPKGYVTMQKQTPFAAELLFGYRKARRGVLIAGIADALGFTLQARDRQTEASSTLREADIAWQTLRIQ